MTPTATMDRMRELLPRELVLRYGIEMDISVDLSLGIHQYVKREDDEDADGRESAERKADHICWATLTLRNPGQKGLVTYIAINGKGKSWGEAVRAFKADLKEKLGKAKAVKIPAGSR